MSGRLVLIGVDDSLTVEPLDHARADVEAVRALVPLAVPGQPLLDPTRAQVQSLLDDLQGAISDGEPLFLMWSGHGQPSAAGGLRLLAADSKPGAAAGLSAGDVAAACAGSGSAQILLVFDVCHAGAGLDATGVAGRVLAGLPPNAQHVWTGVLSSAGEGERARDGLFGRRLQELLEHGPTDPDLRRRWSRHSRMVRGDDLCDALLKQWTDDDVQRPDLATRGSAWWLLPNPLWQQDAPEQVVEHLLLAARGGEAVEEQSWFRGRQDEVDRLVRWVTAGRAGMFVVTGSPGTGKSALVGRVVSASVAAERDWLLAGGAVLGHADPGRGSVSAHVHARGLTVDLLAAQLDAQLVRAGVLPGQETGERNAAELVGALQRSSGQRQTGHDFAAAGHGGVSAMPVVVVDGLDEARQQAFEIAGELLVRLSGLVTVIIATRELSAPDGGDRSLLGVLGPSEVLDLNDPDVRARGREALREYVLARLNGVDQRMDPALVACQLGAGHDAEAAIADRPFLLARVVTDQLRGVPVNTDRLGWEQQIAGSVDAALEIDLARVSPPTSSEAAPELTRSPILGRLGLARGLLTALTWAQGAGFPEEEWKVAAGALLGHEITGGDVSRVLDHLGRHVVQDGEEGVAVYRVAHQSLADHLRPRTPPLQDDPQAEAVALALLEHYARLLATGLLPQAPTYLWLHIAGHVTLGGPLAVDRLRHLAHSHPALRGDLASALVAQSVRLQQRGLHTIALPAAEEAVDLYRGLVADNPAFLSYFASSLSNLGVRLGEVGRSADALAPAEEAVDLYRGLVADNPAFLSDLAGSLNNLGGRLSEVGRRADALAPTEEAVALSRVLSRNNSAFVPDLASSLSNLGVRLGGVGRSADALAPAEEAVALYRVLAEDNSAFVPDLASSLGNLGNRLGGVGRRADALNLTEEAVALRRVLAEDSSASVPDLASSLNNLGGRLSGVGRRADALAATEEAVALYRVLVGDNSAFVPNLAGSLSNLGVRLSEMGRSADALAPAEEAVVLYRVLAGDNAAFMPDLAGSLSNLGVRFSEVGRSADALAPTEEAVALGRGLVAENAAFLPDLAGSLSNLGGRLSEVGRSADALAPTEEAVALSRVLAEDNSAFVPLLASGLNNLGIQLSEVGRSADALAPTEEAVVLSRVLAEGNSAFVPDLAGSLSNLGNRFSEVGRSTDALAPAEEAVALYRVLARDNSAFVPDLARSLGNLSGRFSEVGRSADALALAEEAVGLYRVLARGNSAFVPDLAHSLSNLGGRLSELGRERRAEAHWQQAITVLPGAGPVLLLYRARLADPGDPEAARWLQQALGVDPLDGDRGLVAALHEQARRHRTADPATFDTAWTTTEKPLPGWLTVDPTVLATAQAWIATETYVAERAHLAAHPELLAAEARVALDEALLSVSDADAQRYQKLRATARSDGVDAAYRPLLLGLLAWEFARADLSGRQELLRERFEDLQSDRVIEVLSALATDEDDATSLAGETALALLGLARLGAHEPALNALAFPGAMSALLRQLAVTAPSEVLAGTAELALLTAPDPGAAAIARCMLALAATEPDASSGGHGDAELVVAGEHLAAAIQLDRGQIPAWIGQLAVLAGHRPGALRLIPLLAQALTPMPPPTGVEPDPGHPTATLDESDDQTVARS